MALSKFVTLDAGTSYTWAEQCSLGSDDPTVRKRRIVDQINLKSGTVPVADYQRALRGQWRFLFNLWTSAAIDDFRVFGTSIRFYFYPDSATSTKHKVKWVNGYHPVPQRNGRYNLVISLEEV